MTMLLKLGQINGESEKEGYIKWIEINSLQFGTGRGISAASGGGSRQPSDPSVSEVVFTKPMTIDSGELFFQSITGTAGMKAEVHLINTADKKNTPYLKILLHDALISGYSVSSGGDRPTESVSLNFTKIEMQYDQYDGKTLVASGSPKAFDISKGVEFAATMK
jgi:type VI secretion system secreted protein Hcp